MNTVTRIEEHGDRIYVKIDSDDHDKIEEAIGTVFGDPFYDSDEPKDPKYVLRQFFDNHAEFYDYVGFNSGTKHGGTGKNFDRGGFREFVKEFFETDASRLKYLDRETDADKLQLVCDAVAEKLGETIAEHEDRNKDSVVAQSNIRFDSEEATELNDPELMEEAVLMTNNSAHKIEVKKLEDADGMDDIQERVTEQTKNVYETQVKAEKQSLKNRISDLQEKLEEERQKMMVKGIELVDQMDNWKVEDGRLVYTERIHPETVQKKNDTEPPRELTEEAKEKFYIDGLSMKINTTVGKLYYDEGYHPHALSTKTCSGSFKEPLEEALEKAVDQMKQIDLHSFANNDAEREMKDNFDEYTKSEEEQDENLEVWTT